MTAADGPGVQHITAHAFEPERDGWWSTCGVCGLAEAAHTTTTLCPKCGGAGGFPDAGACATCHGTGRRDSESVDHAMREAGER